MCAFFIESAINTPLNTKDWQILLTDTQIRDYENMSTMKGMPGGGGGGHLIEETRKKNQTMVDLITFEIHVPVPLLTYSN